MILIIGTGMARSVESGLNPALFSRTRLVAEGINSTPRNETLVLLGVNFKYINWLGSLIYPLESDVKIRVMNRNEKPSQIIESLYPFMHVWVIFVPVQLNNSNDIEMLKSLKEQEEFLLMSEFKSTFHFQRSK